MPENDNKDTNNAFEDDDLGIKKLMHEVTDTNKRIDEAYDERIKRLEKKKKLIPDEKDEEEHQARISFLKERLNELKGKISDARREGKDPLIPDLMIRNVNAKIKLAEVTHDAKDYDAVENILNRAELELKEALEEEELNIKKEINEKLKQSIAKETGKAISED